MSGFKKKINDPNVNSDKKLVGGVELDYVIKQSRDILNAPVDKNFGYPGKGYFLYVGNTERATIDK